MGEITKAPMFVRLMDHLMVKSEPKLKAEKIAALKEELRTERLLEPMLDRLHGPGVAEAVLLEEMLNRELDRSLQGVVDREFAGYRTWLLNTGLVLVVAFLDSYLDELLREILKADPKRLLTASQERQVELKSILEAQNIEALIASEIDYVARRAAFMNIRDRIAFLQKRLGIPMADILTWRDYAPQAQARLRRWDVDRIVTVYNSRHEVAHRGNATPLTSIEELSEVADVFARLVLSLSTEVGRSFGIPLDWDASRQKFAELMAKVDSDEGDHAGSGPIA